MDVVKRWLGLVVRMNEDAPPRRVFAEVVGDYRQKKGRVRVGKTRLESPGGGARAAQAPEKQL